jgi:vitellogenic carboxypeptidase-like protein/serine carboxypeptidase-like clade 4
MFINIGIFLLLAFAVTCTHAAGVRDGKRIVEKDIAFPQTYLQDGAPIVDPPKRSAGYFKLNRTVDAHMFFFLFQSRNQVETDPGNRYTVTASLQHLLTNIFG